MKAFLHIWISQVLYFTLGVKLSQFFNYLKTLLTFSWNCCLTMLCSCGNTGPFRKQCGGTPSPEQAKSYTGWKRCWSGWGNLGLKDNQCLETEGGVEQRRIFTKIWTSQCLEMLFRLTVIGTSSLAMDNGVDQLLAMASFCFRHPWKGWHLTGDAQGADAVHPLPPGTSLGSNVPERAQAWDRVSPQLEAKLQCWRL